MSVLCPIELLHPLCPHCPLSNFLLAGENILKIFKYLPLAGLGVFEDETRDIKAIIAT
jgi:hypothetical protein